MLKKLETVFQLQKGNNFLFQGFLAEIKDTISWDESLSG